MCPCQEHVRDWALFRAQLVDFQSVKSYGKLRISTKIQAGFPLSVPVDARSNSENAIQCVYALSKPENLSARTSNPFFSKRDSVS